jgi:hypothetical protein
VFEKYAPYNDTKTALLSSKSKLAMSLMIASGKYEKTAKNFQNARFGIFFSSFFKSWLQYSK